MQKQVPQQGKANNVIHLTFSDRDAENHPMIERLYRTGNLDLLSIAQRWEEGNYAEAARIAQKINSPSLTDTICEDGISHKRKMLMGLKSRKVQDMSTAMYIAVTYREIAQLNEITGKEDAAKTYATHSKEAWDRVASMNQNNLIGQKRT